MSSKVTGMRKTSSRWSLSKFVSKSFSNNKKKVDEDLEEAIAIVEEKVDKGNKIIQYKGVSLAHLVYVRDEICEEEFASGVKLYYVKEDIEDLDNDKRTIPAGKTILKTDKVRNKKDEFLGDVAYMDGSVRFNRKDPRLELKKRIDWTVEDVCEHFVILKTMKKKSFYIDTIDCGEVGDVYQGAFLSQSRATRFTDIVDGLVEHYKSKGRTDLESIFIWIDLFGANQPLLTTRDEDLPQDIQEKREQLLYSGLHEAIRYFDERIIFLDSWMNPRPLTRAWCIWEIYGAVLSNKPLDIVLSPHEQEKFVDVLLEDFESISEAISKMDMRNAECFAARDLEMIQSAVEEMDGGFSKLNASVIKELNNWLVRATANAVENRNETMKRVSRRGNKVHELAQSKLFLQAGKLMLRQDKHDEAKSYFDKSYELRVKHCGEISIPVAEVLVQRGGWEQDKSLYSDSLKTFEKAKEIYVAVHKSEEHEHVGNVLAYIALIYYRLDLAKDGVIAAERAMKVLKATLGPRCKEMVEAMTWYVWCLCDCGRTNEALKVGIDALTLAKEVYNPRHLKVARMYTTLGRVYQVKSRRQERLAVDEEALQIMEENLGRDSSDVAIRLVNLGLSKRDLDMFEEARQDQHEGLGLLLNIYGESHDSTAWAMNRLSDTLKNLGELDDALSLAKRAMAVQTKLLGEKHQETIWSKNDVANLERQIKKRDDELKRLPELRETVKNAEDELEALNELSKVLALSKKHLDEGIEKTFALLGLVETKHGKDSPEICFVLERLGKLLEANGDLDEARDIFGRCVEIQTKAGKRVNRGLLEKVEKSKNLDDLKNAKAVLKDLKMKGESTASQAYKVASILIDLKRKAEAVPYMENAVDVVEEKDVHDKWLIELADLLIETRKFKKAVIRLDQVLETRVENSPEYGDTLFKMGTVQQRMYNNIKALDLCREAFEITSNLEKGDKLKLKERVEKLIDLLVDTDRIAEAQQLMHEMMDEDGISLRERMTEIQIRQAETAEQSIFSMPPGTARDAKKLKVGWLWCECGREENAMQHLQGFSVDTLARTFDARKLEEIAYAFEKNAELKRSKEIIQEALSADPNSLSLKYALQRVEIKMQIDELEAKADEVMKDDPISAAELLFEAMFVAGEHLEIQKNNRIDAALELVEKNAPESILHGKLLIFKGIATSNDDYHGRAIEILNKHLDKNNETLWETQWYLGMMLCFVDEYRHIPKSVELFQSAIRLAREAFGTGSIEAALIVPYLSRALKEDPRRLEVLEEALTLQRKEGREEHHFIVVCLSLGKAESLMEFKRYEEAFEILEALRELHLRDGFHENWENWYGECKQKLKNKS